MRKFGVEIELNSFDQRDFKKFPLFRNENPEGIHEVAEIIQSLGLPVKVDDWHHTHNNQKWICKPDSSCGIEVCSPVCTELDDIINFIKAISENEKIKADDRCSFHVHFDISDCLVRKEKFISGSFPFLNYDFENSFDLASILAWWVKCEPIFFDSIPDSRKNNKYCQCIGISDVFSHDENVDPKNIIKKLGENKYLSANSYHLLKGNRCTIEFRLAEAKACLDPQFAENWINLLDYFIRASISKGLPDSYCWINPEEFIQLLNFEVVSPEIEKIRNWFLFRIKNNIFSNLRNWDFNFRKSSIVELQGIFSRLQLDKQS